MSWKDWEMGLESGGNDDYEERMSTFRFYRLNIGTLGLFGDIVEFVLPEVQRRGSFQRDVDSRIIRK